MRYIMFLFCVFQECSSPWLKTASVKQHPSTQDPPCCHCAHEVTSGPTAPSLPPLVNPFPSPLSLSFLRPTQPWARRSLAVSNQLTYAGSPRIVRYAANCGVRISVGHPGWIYCWTCRRPAPRPSFAMPGTLTTDHSMSSSRRTTS